MKTCVIIPTYNEEKAIGPLVRTIRQLGYEVLVVDDGSHDQTGRMAREEGAYVITNFKNCGKGFSLRQGFQYALEHKFDIIVIMDGDGQHDPSDLNLFLQKAQEDNAHIVIGNRMIDPKNMPWVRRVTNTVMSWIVAHMTGQDIPDSQCGFRLIKADAIKNIKLFSCRYEIESEILIAASKKGYKIVSVPIKTIYQSESSYINPITDTVRFFKLIFGRKG